MQALSKHLRNLLRFSFSKNKFFIGKITSCALFWSISNVLTKSRKAERCTDIMLKQTFQCLSVTVEDLNVQQRYRYEDITILGTQYFVLLDTTSGARQAHDTSVRLIFPALKYKTYGKLKITGSFGIYKTMYHDKSCLVLFRKKNY